MECIMHNASPISKNLIGKYFTEDEKLKGIVDYLNNNPRRFFKGKGVYIRMVNQYHGDPSGNLMSSNTPLSPASEKNLPHNSKLKSFANLVSKPECAVAVINKLHELMDSKTTPKSILMPIRAAMDAGAIHRPSWGEFCAEFGSNKLKSKTSLTYYTDTTETPYYGQAFAKMTQTFKSIIA